jgi:gamma-glutamyltranspeptidase
MRWLVLFACALTLPAQRGFPERPHGRSMTITPKGIVATSQTLASQAGASMLARAATFHP